MRLEPGRAFGSVRGRQATVHILENAVLRVRITDFGARIVSVEAPDRTGRRDHVALGFEDAAAYDAAGGSFGAVLGRVANRIAGGHFILDGRRFELSKNDNGNTLHGGADGFGKRLWTVEEATPELLRLRLVSPDGDAGFPGELTVIASYELAGAELTLNFQATTTAPTPVSLSGHSYFNLGGTAHADILDHEAMLAAEQYLPTDARQIPTGERRPVAGTPFDFTRPKAIGADIRQVDPQLVYGKGYDHYFVLHRAEAGTMKLAARIRHAGSGRGLEIRTTHPGVQFYSGNTLDGAVVGRGGAYRQSAGFAVEPHGFPDAPNQPGFPAIVLRPRDIYRATIGYRFTKD